MIHQIDKKGLLGKKAVMYSISVTLVLIALLIYFSTQSRIFRADESSYLERARLHSMKSFVDDFEQVYAGQILKAAAKPSMAELSRYGSFTRADMVLLMKTSSSGPASINSLLSTDENFGQAISTLSFSLEDADLDYYLVDVVPVNFTHLRLDFVLSYSFTAEDMVWHRQGLQIPVVIDVMGLTHPSFASGNNIISADWIQSTSLPCFANQLVTDSSACGSINIVPLPVCGNGVLESGEQCDDGNNFDLDGCSSACVIETP